MDQGPEKILIIDDDESLNRAMVRTMTKHGYLATGVHSIHEGKRSFEQDSFDLVFLDVKLPDGSGLDLLPEIANYNNPPEVIIVTGNGNPEGAEIAISSGAWDYLLKPCSQQEILLSLKQALDYRKQKHANLSSFNPRDFGIIGESPVMKSMYREMDMAASSRSPVLLSGSTGTGKELIANAIHKSGQRNDKPFIVVDCATLPGSLAESILFGHKKGSFTGADREKVGLIEKANGGTLFLDEIGELDLELQKKFLRILQEKKMMPVGGTAWIECDFRLLSATNRNLEEMVAAGTFREDLLYRIRSQEIIVPDLKQRVGDIRRLTESFLNSLSDQTNSDVKGISRELIDSLNSYDWPGNVRELEQALVYSWNNSAGHEIIYPIHLPVYLRIAVAKRNTESLSGRSGNDLIEYEQKAKPAPASNSRELNGDTIPSFKEFRESVLDRAEKEYFENLLHKTERDIQKSCQVSGLSRTRLYEYLKKLGL